MAKDIDEWIVQHSVHSPVFPGEVDTFPSILWADDIAVPVATSQPEHLVPLLLKLLCAVRDCLHDRGIHIEFCFREKPMQLFPFEGRVLVNAQRISIGFKAGCHLCFL